MGRPASRIADADDLGRAGRRLDMALGAAAVAPILALGGLALISEGRPAWIRTGAAIWAGSLLAFFSGVRRGLSFSEAGGARPAEIIAFLIVFAVAAATLAFRSPGLGGLGLALVGVQDRLAASRRLAPRYFRSFRPVQASVACLALLLVAVRDGF